MKKSFVVVSSVMGVVIFIVLGWFISELIDEKEKPAEDLELVVEEIPQEENAYFYFKQAVQLMDLESSKKEKTTTGLNKMLAILYSKCF